MYTTFIFEPIINALMFFYSLFNDMGIAIILLTILIRLLLYPISRKALLGSKKIQELHLKTKKIQEEFKNDLQRQGIELMKIYKEAKINPLASFLNIAIQVVILITLYRVLWLSQKLENILPHLYAITPHPQELSHNFIGFINLATPNFYFALIAALATYWQIKISMVVKKDDSLSAATQSLPQKKDSLQKAQDFTKNLNMTLPLITFIGGLRLPASLTLYWLVSTLFTVAQEYFIKYQNSNNKVKN